MTVEELILTNLGLVERIAKQAARRLPNCIDMDEMVSAGNLGLVQAANRYDPELHPSFPDYARMRIFGAIIDAFRGPHYPRRYEEIPQGWLQGGNTTHDPLDGRSNGYERVPDELIDPQPLPDTVLIEQEEERHTVVCITSARKRLTREEGKVLDANLNGRSLREVGRSAQRSGAWAHYTIHRAKTKLRASFAEIDGKKAA